MALRLLEGALEGVLEPYSPQYYGVIAGCIVYLVTVSSVIVLLIKSGSLERWKEQTQVQTGKGNQTWKTFTARPLLYDELLLARNTLPQKPEFPAVKGKFVSLVPASNEHFRVLFQISNGSICYGSGAYEPFERIWSMLEVGPFATPEDMQTCSLYSNDTDAQHFAVVENVTDRVIGAVSYINNRPKDLAITIDSLWLTPAYQNQSRLLGHEAIYLMARSAFLQQYRRVETTTDTHNFVARKILFKLHMTHEGTLRKYRIVRDSNRDVCVYAYTNSDWFGRGGGTSSVGGISVKREVELLLYGRVLKEGEEEVVMEEQEKVREDACRSKQHSKPHMA